MAALKLGSRSPVVNISFSAAGQGSATFLFDPDPLFWHGLGIHCSDLEPFFMDVDLLSESCKLAFTLLKKEMASFYKFPHQLY